MLSLTENATEVIRELVNDHPGGGLRIFSQSTDSSELHLALSIADHPQPTDEVLEQSGCQVFLDQEVAPAVDGQILDAHVLDGQRVEFNFVS
jgi:Fe-S cluster assembly iron-binding protein IscA